MRDLASLAFVKYPEPGKVKTRLAAAIGDQAACNWYREFIKLTLAKTRLLPQLARYVTFSPPEKKEAFQAMFADDAHWFPQAVTEDLGVRIHQAVHAVLERGHRGVLTIGSDSPSVPLAYLQQAAQVLSEHDLVLGPSEDGGYYLIGLKSAPAALFENIAWSTSRVLDQTLAAARRMGLSVFLLPEWYDVDDEETLKKFQLKSRMVLDAPGQAI